MPLFSFQGFYYILQLNNKSRFRYLSTSIVGLLLNQPAATTHNSAALFKHVFFLIDSPCSSTYRVPVHQLVNPQFLEACICRGKNVCYFSVYVVQILEEMLCFGDFTSSIARSSKVLTCFHWKYGEDKQLSWQPSKRKTRFAYTQ